MVKGKGGSHRGDRRWEVRNRRQGARMAGSIYYSLDTSRLGTAVIINNLHTEQVRHKVGFSITV